MNKLILMIILVFVFACKTSEYKDYPIIPVPFNQVTLTDNFWKPRIITERDVTVPFSLHNGKDAINRLKMGGDYLHGISDEKPRPHRYISSDLYKVMEGASHMVLLLLPILMVMDLLNYLIDFRLPLWSPFLLVVLTSHSDIKTLI